jgi:hypothetical protein
MKNWLKYILLSLSLIIIVSGNSYAKSSISKLDFSFNKKNVKNKTENKSLIINLDQISDSDEILVELDEEDNIHSDDFSGVSFDNSFYNEAYTILHTSFLWKKIAFKNVELGTLQNKIFILVRNLRI